MSRVTVSWNDRPILRKVRVATNKGIGAVALAVASRAQRTLGQRSGGRPSAPGSPPNSQSGRLRGSIVATKPKNLRAYAGTNLVYGRIHELGGTITAKTAKRLAIPYTDSKGRKRIARPKTVHIPARPYLRPAANYIQQRAAGIFAREARKDLRRSLGVDQ